MVQPKELAVVSLACWRADGTGVEGSQIGAEDLERVLCQGGQGPWCSRRSWQWYHWHAGALMEQGLKGVKLALKILNEYYAKEGKAHGAAEGAGSGIIGMLEVIESDFTKGLTEMIAAERAG